MPRAARTAARGGTRRPLHFRDPGPCFLAVILRLFQKKLRKKRVFQIRNVFFTFFTFFGDRAFFQKQLRILTFFVTFFHVF